MCHASEACKGLKKHEAKKQCKAAEGCVWMNKHKACGPNGHPDADGASPEEATDTDSASPEEEVPGDAVPAEGGAGVAAEQTNAELCEVTCAIDPPNNLKALGAFQKAVNAAALNSKETLTAEAEATAAAAQQAVVDGQATVDGLATQTDEAEATAKTTATQAGDKAAEVEELRRIQTEAIAHADALKNQGWMSRVGKIVSNLDLTYDVREETDATQKAVAQRDLADGRASEADDAQAKALVAQSQADALKIMAGDAKKMLEEGIEYSEQAEANKEDALGQMASAKSRLLRGMFTNAVHRTAQRASIEQRVADCKQKCTAILDAIEGAAPYTPAVLRAISMKGFVSEAEAGSA